MIGQPTPTVLGALLGVAGTRGILWAERAARKLAGDLPPWPGYTEKVQTIARRKTADLGDDLAQELARHCAESAGKRWEKLRLDPEELHLVRCGR